MLDRLTIERMEATVLGGPVLVALSGGGNSTALLVLLAAHFGVARLRAAIVDHALRSGSDEDAKRALEFAKTLGVDAEILTLSWTLGENQSQQSARFARHRVLCAAARAHGAHVIALGHNGDDQAETILMRAASGSTWRGLAGIAPFAPAPVWPDGRGIMFARPLLNARRTELRVFLKQRDLDWIDDPANKNVTYERVRTRARLAELERAAVDPTRLVRIARGLRALAGQLDAAAVSLIERAARFEQDTITLDRQCWEGDVTTRQRALSVLIAAASGQPREPAAEAVERLEQRMSMPDFRGATLGGATLTIHRQQIVLARDSGALSGRADGGEPLPPLPLPPAMEVVWDGRLALTASAAGAVVYAEGSRPRIETADPAIGISSRWLLAERVAHMLAAAENAPNSKMPQNKINTPKP